MKIIKKASEIKACCASCNGSGWSGGVDGFVKIVQLPKCVLKQQMSKQRAAENGYKIVKRA